jgi:hypothetical protein
MQKFLHADLPVAAALVALFVGGCADFERPTAPQELGDAPFLSATAATGSDRLIVTLPPGVDPLRVARAHGLEPRYVYTHVKVVMPAIRTRGPAPAAAEAAGAERNERRP